LLKATGFLEAVFFRVTLSYPSTLVSIDIMAAQKDYHVQFLLLLLSEVTETGLATTHASYNTITIGPHIINPFVRYICS